MKNIVIIIFIRVYTCTYIQTRCIHMLKTYTQHRITWIDLKLGSDRAEGAGEKWGERREDVGERREGMGERREGV